MEVAVAATLGTVASSVFYGKKSANIQKKQIKQADSAAKADYELNKKQSQMTLSEERRKNRNLLDQQKSAYKARLGAGGMTTKNGSGQTVMNTLQREHDTEDKFLTEQANISLESLLNGINQKSSRNLLSLKAISNSQKEDNFGDFMSFGRSIVK